MFCPGCSARNEGGERFCRKCGATLPGLSGGRGGEGVDQTLNARPGMTVAHAGTVAQKDPDELTGSGVASFFIGDGFFFTSIFLSVLNSSVKSWLWLLLLIPAFFYFGKGFSDVWQARQIRRRLKVNELEAGASVFLSTPSVTERTTRELRQ